MSLLRTFIALEIRHELQQIIHEETAHLRNTIGALVRWVPPGNMHLTLKFLGNISQASVDILVGIQHDLRRVDRPGRQYQFLAPEINPLFLFQRNRFDADALCGFGPIFNQDPFPIIHLSGGD